MVENPEGVQRTVTRRGEDSLGSVVWNLHAIGLPAVFWGMVYGLVNEAERVMVRRWIVLALVAATAATAGPITFVKVVDSEDGVFEHFAAPGYNDNGVLGFWAAQYGTGTHGIFTTTLGGPVNTVSLNTGPANDFGIGWVAINNQDKVAFWSLNDDASVSISYGDQNGVTTVWDTSMSYPGQGQSYYLSPWVDTNDNGTVSFWTQFNTGLQGNYLWNAGTTNEILAWQDGYHGFWGATSINNSEAFTTWAQYGSSQAIVRVSGGVDTWLAQADPWIPTPLQNLGRFPVINNLGEVAWWGDLGGGNVGIYKTSLSGVTSQILALSYAPAPVYGFNDLGTVAYIDGITGALAYNNGSLAEVILSPGDLVEGKVVTSISITSNSLNNNNEVAVYLTFQDLSRGLYVAGLPVVPEPGTLALLLCGATTLWWRRRR